MFLKQISTKFSAFGVLLLEDSCNGAVIDAITHKHHHDPDQINHDVLKRWLRGEGRKPVTWKTLADVLRAVKLITLAEEIEAVNTL